jgi:pimeloyl-ACP methyl ester carboxylesterase
MLNDLKALIEYLRKEYNQEKVYLAGHSWGAYLGAIFTHRYPEYVKYYIGTGQKVTLKATESDKYNFVKNQALKQNNLKLLQKLEFL